MGLRGVLYRDCLAQYGATLAQHCGFVAVSPLIIRLADETGGDLEAVASDPMLIESGLSQEPLLVQWKMHADPFDRSAALWVLGRCAFEDAERWLSEFPWMLPGPDLWLAVNLDYSLGTGATRKVLREAMQEGAGGGSLSTWLRDWSPNAEVEPFAHWWGRCPPALARKRIVRAVDRLTRAADLGSLEPRDVGAPSETLPAGCAPMPEALDRLCRRLERLPRQGELTRDEMVAAWEQVRGYARTLDRQRRRRPALAVFASALLPRATRSPEAASVRRSA